MLSIFVAFLLISSIFCNLLIKLPQGHIQGFLKKSYNDRVFIAFEGIPYAIPPVGKLRFKEPQLYTNWSGILVANKNVSCPQYANEVFFGSEDCLYLNVYIPRNYINSSSNFDIVVHIHGGFFLKDSALTDSLPDYLMDRDLIFVTMNYRLGPLGFLSTEDVVVGGNNGLKDQNLAMKWVKNNIQHFGGNPNSITLTGFSAGGSCVHYHILSPLSKGLFNRAYSISGTALNIRSFQQFPLENAKKLAKNLNCSKNSSKLMIDCLRNVPVELLIKTDLKFKPSVERNNVNKFLSDHPYKLMKNGLINDVPWITTNVADEAYFLMNSIYKKKPAEIYKNWISEGSNILQLNDSVKNNKIVETLRKIEEKYKINENLTYFTIQRIMTDRFFFFPEDLDLRTHAAAIKHPVYYAIFNYVPNNIQCSLNKTAASHCSDARLLFKNVKNPKKLKSDDEKMMILLTEFLEKYAKTGVPQLGDVKWLPINPNDSFDILSINSSENIEMVKKNELIDRKFWDSLPIMENDHMSC